MLEAMRLYPPAWSVGREALVDVEIGGYRLPKGAEFFMSPVGHAPRSRVASRTRSAFKPERWAGDRAAPPAAVRLLSRSAAARASASATGSR